MCQLSVEFFENRLSSFCAILLINKLANKLTNTAENITFLAEVTIRNRSASVIWPYTNIHKIRHRSEQKANIRHSSRT